MNEIDQLAIAAGMPIPEEYRDGVFRQWLLDQALAAPLMAFDLPDDVLPAPVFAP